MYVQILWPLNVKPEVNFFNFYNNSKIKTLKKKRKTIGSNGMFYEKISPPQKKLNKRVNLIKSRKELHGSKPDPKLAKGRRRSQNQRQVGAGAEARFGERSEPVFKSPSLRLKRPKNPRLTPRNIYFNLKHSKNRFLFNLWSRSQLFLNLWSRSRFIFVIEAVLILPGSSTLFIL